MTSVIPSPQSPSVTPCVCRCPTAAGDFALSPGTVGFTVTFSTPGEMFQGFPGDIDTGSRGSSSPSIESQYLSSVDSFGSPPTTSAPQVSSN